MTGDSMTTRTTIPPADLEAKIAELLDVFFTKRAESAYSQNKLMERQMNCVSNAEPDGTSDFAAKRPD
jgi:hypothetical protein